MDLKSKFLLNLRLFFTILTISLFVSISFAAFHLIKYKDLHEEVDNYPVQMWIIISLSVVMLLSSYFFARQLINNISKLKHFAGLATRGEPIDNLEPFVHDELGEISSEIISLYTQLQKTRGDLSRKELEKEQESDRLKRELTNNISHELKTPVSSIHGYLDTILSNPEMDKEKILSFVNKSHDQTIRLSSLLKDMATITRMDEASYMIEKEPVDLTAIIMENIEGFGIILKDKNFEISTNIVGPLKMLGNSYLLNSIFSNLIDNSLAYSGGSKISIDLISQNREEYMISFADNGVGIADIHMTRIFERFYRIDKGRSRKMGGTGLGLSIVKNAVLFHGGRIEAQRGDKGGLTFIIKLNKGISR